MEQQQLLDQLKIQFDRIYDLIQQNNNAAN